MTSSFSLYQCTKSVLLLRLKRAIVYFYIILVFENFLDLHGGERMGLGIQS